MGSCSFTNQVLGQLDILKNWKEGKGYKNEVYLLPKELDEKVARLHLPALGAQLTELTKEQADYIGVKVEGPFKGDSYRYEWSRALYSSSARARFVTCAMVASKCCCSDMLMSGAASAAACVRRGNA